MVFRNGCLKWEPVFCFFWGGFCMVFFFFSGNLGHPFLSSFVSNDLITAPHLMASWGATHHKTTTLTHQPQWTRVYYRTTIFQPNTVNRHNEEMKKDETGGRKRGTRTVKREEGEVGQKKLKHAFIYAYIWDRCLHNNAIDNRYRHSHCLLNLGFALRSTGVWKHKRNGRGRGDIHKGNILFSTPREPKWLQTLSETLLKTRLICSSILVRPHESLRAVQLFVVTERLWFHQPSQATKMEFAGFIS